MEKRKQLTPSLTVYSRLLSIYQLLDGQAGMLAELRTKGITIGIADSIIASTALQLGVPLLTNNIEHYHFQDLKVVRGLELE